MTHASIVLPNMETTSPLFSQMRKQTLTHSDSCRQSDSTPIVLFLLFYPYGNEQHTLLIVLYIGMSMSHCSLPLFYPYGSKHPHSLPLLSFFTHTPLSTSPLFYLYGDQFPRSFLLFSKTGSRPIVSVQGPFRYKRSSVFSLRKKELPLL